MKSVTEVTAGIRGANDIQAPTRRVTTTARRGPHDQVTPIPKLRPTEKAPRKPLAHRSDKTEALYRERRPLVEKLLQWVPVCEVCDMERSTDVHEVLTRARGGSILDLSNLKILGPSCHRRAHEDTERDENGQTFAERHNLLAHSWDEPT